MAQREFVEWLLFWILETSHFEFERDSRVRLIPIIENNLHLGRLGIRSRLAPVSRREVRPKSDTSEGYFIELVLLVPD